MGGFILVGMLAIMAVAAIVTHFQPVDLSVDDWNEEF